MPLSVWLRKGGTWLMRQSGDFGELRAAFDGSGLSRWECWERAPQDPTDGRDQPHAQGKYKQYPLLSPPRLARETLQSSN